MSRNYLIWQYHDKPKALATIKSIYAITDDSFKTVLNIADILDIDTATGYVLDLVGRHVGISRVLSQALAKEFFGFVESSTSLAFDIGEFYQYGDALNATIKLNDDDYRFFIKAKILKNYQSGNTEYIVDSIKYLMGDTANTIDNLNMTMHVVINREQLNSIKFYAIKNLDILARPVGVLYRFLVITNNTPFGFYRDHRSYGFNIGKFVRLQEIGKLNEITR